MSKIYNYYANKVDKTWYQSSNIKYSECVDNENAYKTLKIVFSNGTQYQYNDVDVRDYLMFREDASQGQALNKYIKKRGYEYQKLEDADLSSIENELEFVHGNGIILENNDKFIVKSSREEVLYEQDKLSDETYEVVKNTLSGIGHIIKETKTKEEGN